MYEETFKKLTNILGKEIELYTEMRNLYADKRKALVKNNINELTKIDTKIIENYESIKKVDSDRVDIVKTFGEDIPNMTELIEKSQELCPKYSLTLREQQELLNSISSSITVLNLTNMELLKHGMILADKKLNIIIDCCAPKGNSYSDKGIEQTPDYEMSTIIRDA